MAKKIVGFIKLQVPAGKANPSPPIGPALGQRGLNIMEFCKGVQRPDAGLRAGPEAAGGDHRLRRQVLHLRAEVAPATVLLKKAAKIDKGSAKAHMDKVGTVTLAQLEEIAKTKMKDLNAADLAGAVKIIAGSARSMGLTVEGV